MADPPIFTEHFLLLCIQYEYKKHKDESLTEEIRVQIHQNICEMMLADEIRQDVLCHASQGNSQGSSMDTEGMSSGAMSVDATTPDEEVRPAPITARQATTSSSSSETGARAMGNMTLRDATGNTRKRQNPTDSRASSSFGHGEQESKRKRDEAEGIPAAVPGPPTDSDVKEDIDERSNLNFLKENEEEAKINILSFMIMNEYLNMLVDNEFDPSELGKITWTEVSLSDMRSKVYLYGHFYRDHCLTIPMTPPDYELNRLQYNNVNCTIDHGKVKVLLTTSHNKTDSLLIEHWDDPEGTWVWHQDSIRFYKGMMYEDIAANSFINCLKHTEERLELLEFDIESKMKWTPDGPPSMKFCCKLKKALENCNQYNIREFQMKVLKNQEARDIPFELRYMVPGQLLEVKLSVWDDGQEGQMDMSGLTNFIEEYNGELNSQLNMEDPNLRFFTPDVSVFKYIRLLKVTLDHVTKIKNKLLKREVKIHRFTLRSKQNFDHEGIQRELGAVDGSVKLPMGDSMELEIRISDTIVLFQTPKLSKSKKKSGSSTFNSDDSFSS